MLKPARLKTRRNELGLTQTALAERAGVSLSHYSMVEKGEVGVSVAVLEALLKVLNLSIVDVWVEEGGNRQTGTPEVSIETAGGRTVVKYVIQNIDADLVTVVNKWAGLDAGTKAAVLKLIGKTPGNSGDMV